MTSAPQVIASGVAVLRVIEAGIRAQLARPAADPALWLELREVTTLAGRLEPVVEHIEELGVAFIMPTGQDFAALESWADDLASSSPYADDDCSMQAAALRQLRELLMDESCPVREP